MVLKDHYFAGYFHSGSGVILVHLHPRALLDLFLYQLYIIEFIENYNRSEYALMKQLTIKYKYEMNNIIVQNISHTIRKQTHTRKTF